MNEFNELYESIMNEGKDKAEFKILKFFKNTKKEDMKSILSKYKDNTSDINRNKSGNYDITIYESMLNEAKSREASMVLKLMDSKYDDLGYQKLVDIVVTATGVNKKKLEKELDVYV